MKCGLIFLRRLFQTDVGIVFYVFTNRHLVLNLAGHPRFPFPEKKGKSKNKKKGASDGPKSETAASATPAVDDEPFVPPSAADRTPAPAQSAQAAANVDRKKKRENLKKVR